jgi:hypothetical protein
MAYTLIGGTAVGTVLILLFLPALYAAWFLIKTSAVNANEETPALLGLDFSFSRNARGQVLRAAETVRARVVLASSRLLKRQLSLRSRDLSEMRLHGGEQGGNVRT